VATLGSQYLLALVAVVLLALGGGWLLSGEVLDPVERAMAAQRRFVANASHELRTPISAIRVGAEVALDDPDPTVDGLRAVLRRMVDATDDTERLMASLLTLAQADEGTRDDEAVPLDVLVRGLLPRDARAALAPTIVHGDAALLRQAVTNLLDNAARHGVGPATVTLRDGELTVSNRGPVIAPEDLARLAEPFERLRRSAAPGNGLGLSIVRAIAATHGGTMLLAARPEGGLTVTVRLPPAGDGQVTGPGPSWSDAHGTPHPSAPEPVRP
jgi:signal transduction histidine kinase